MTWTKISIHEINQISTLTVSWKHKVHNVKFKLKSWRFNQNPDMWCAMEGGSNSAIQDAWCCHEILSFNTCSWSPVNGPYWQQFKTASYTQSTIWICVGTSDDSCDSQCGPFSTVTLLVHTFFTTEILFLVFFPTWYRGSFFVISLRQLFTLSIFSFMSTF